MGIKIISSRMIILMQHFIYFFLIENLLPEYLILEVWVFTDYQGFLFLGLKCSGIYLYSY